MLIIYGPSKNISSAREYLSERALAMPAAGFYLTDARVPAKSPLRVYNLSLFRDTCHFGGSKTTNRSLLLHVGLLLQEMIP